jgi:hypothetical protein
MINGAHVIILSKDAEADRVLFRDVLGLNHVDVGGGWLIFALPPAEVAIHPADRDSVHEFYLMCEDVNALTASLMARGITCGPVEDQGWGLLTSITLPGGGKLGAYQPRHPRPAPKAASAKKGAPKKKAAKKSASKPAAARKASKRAAKNASKRTAKQPAKKPTKKSVSKTAPKRRAARKRR